MKKLVTIAALSLGLAGCSTTSAITPASLQSDLQSIATAVIGYAQDICGIQPYIEDVESIITTLYPAAVIGTVLEQSVARNICKSVPPVTVTAGGKLGASPTYYPGTTIAVHGKVVDQNKLVQFQTGRYQ